MFSAFLAVALVLAQEGDPLKDAPAITKEQEKLIEQMGDDEYRTREKATKALGELDYKGLRAMYKAAKHKDPEIAVRGRRLVSAYYGVVNSKGETPGIQGLYELKSWKLKSGKTMEVQGSDANEFYTQAGGDSSDMDMARDAGNFKTKEATRILVKKLRDQGFTREDVQEVLDKITEQAEGTNMGDEGHRRFREMQGLPQYEPGCFGILPIPLMNPLPGLRNFFLRPRPFMPPAIN